MWVKISQGHKFINPGIFQKGFISKIWMSNMKSLSLLFKSNKMPQIESQTNRLRTKCQNISYITLWFWRWLYKVRGYPISKHSRCQICCWYCGKYQWWISRHVAELSLSHSCFLRCGGLCWDISLSSSLSWCCSHHTNCWKYLFHQ